MSISADAGNPLKGLQAVRQAGALPPVHLWNPPFCGDIDMRIAADGTWYYMNSPIGRKPLFTLFSRVLRKDGEKYFLVTPVEKCGITVDDAPLYANRMEVSGAGRERVLTFHTATDDLVLANADHPLRFEDEKDTGGLKPYVLVRDNLEALVSRALFYDLVALGEINDAWFGVWSGGCFFKMQRADEL